MDFLWSLFNFIWTFVRLDEFVSFGDSVSFLASFSGLFSK